MDIAKILKYCPKGTKLYSLVDGTVTLESVDNTQQYPIEVITSTGNTSYFTKDGKIFANRPDGECVLFPSKNQRDWEEFRLPVKRGDIMMSDGRAFIISDVYADTLMGKYHEYICGIDTTGAFKVSQSNHHHWTNSFYIPASEEAKKELFDKMKEAGYRWNADTLKLEKIEPEFKEGEVYINKEGDLYLLVGKITEGIGKAAILYPDGNFIARAAFSIPDEGLVLATPSDRNKLFSFLNRKGYRYDKKQYKLIKQEFKPFDKVLVRDDINEKWLPSIFLCYEDEIDKDFPYVCLNGRYENCIPYEGNEYFVGKTVNIH